MREGNHHRFVGDEVFDGHFALVQCEISAARGGILFLNQGQFILDDGEYARFLGKDVEEVFDLLNELFVLRADFVNFQTG